MRNKKKKFKTVCVISP